MTHITSSVVRALSDFDRRASHLVSSEVLRVLRESPYPVSIALTHNASTLVVSPRDYVLYRPPPPFFPWEEDLTVDLRSVDDHVTCHGTHRWFLFPLWAFDRDVLGTFVVRVIEERTLETEREKLRSRVPLESTVTRRDDRRLLREIRRRHPGWFR